jgi:RNA polymerase sigma factor (sigma-70 family)
MNEADARRLWFRREVLPHQAYLMAVARRWCRTGGLPPEDLVHETFVRLMEYAGWQSVSNVRAFAATALRNIVLMEVRRSKVVPIQALDVLDLDKLLDETPSSDRIVEARDELLRLTALISMLPPQCGRVLTLRKIHGLTNAQIAESLGLSISTVEKHLAKGLKRCMEQLDGASIPAPPASPTLATDADLLGPKRSNPW